MSTHSGMGFYTWLVTWYTLTWKRLDECDTRVGHFARAIQQTAEVFPGTNNDRKAWSDFAKRNGLKTQFNAAWASYRRSVLWKKSLLMWCSTLFLAPHKSAIERRCTWCLYPAALPAV